jgi:hypothetical protein
MKMPISLPNYVDPITGTPIVWWTVSTFIIDYQNSLLSVTMNGYFSKATFLAGEAPIVRQLLMSIPANVEWGFLMSTTGADYPATTTQAVVLNEFEIAFQAALLGLPFFNSGAVVNPDNYVGGATPSVGNFTKAHNLGYSPSGAFIINMELQSSQGPIVFQQPTGWDATNFYLNCQTIGINYTIQVWK